MSCGSRAAGSRAPTPTGSTCPTRSPTRSRRSRGGSRRWRPSASATRRPARCTSCTPGAASTPPAASGLVRLVEDRPRPVARAGLVLVALAAIPEGVVEVALGHADAARELCAGVHGAGADLALGAAGGQQLPGLDLRGEVAGVDEHALAAQDVGDEVVGEDRQLVD